jgi:hypothetical protein
MNEEFPSQEKPPERSRLEKIREYIRNVKTYIEERVAAGSDSWIGNMQNRISLIDTLLFGAEHTNEIEGESLAKAQQRLESAQRMLDAIKEKHAYGADIESIPADSREAIYAEIQKVFD